MNLRKKPNPEQKAAHAAIHTAADNVVKESRAKQYAREQEYNRNESKLVGNIQGPFSTEVQGDGDQRQRIRVTSVSSSFGRRMISFVNDMGEHRKITINAFKKLYPGISPNVEEDNS